MPRVLAVYAHPDDEGQVTGTLATLLAAGAEATLVCATRGEVGEISDPTLATPETLWYVRELELRAAMAQIGLADVRFLSFRDSGMAGTADNEDERALHRQDGDLVVANLLAIMREVRPHIVFTWDPDGGYGHPDHVAVHRHVVAAFDGCADPTAHPGAGEPWKPERLYWGAFGPRRFAEFFQEAERRGVELGDFDPRIRARFEEAMRQPEPPTSAILNVSAHVEAKRRARAMHRSQFGEGSLFSRIPDDLRDRFDSEERFYQARPKWPEGAPALAGFPDLE